MKGVQIDEWAKYESSVGETHYRRIGNNLEMVVDYKTPTSGPTDLTFTLPPGVVIDYTKMAPGARVSMSVYHYRINAYRAIPLYNNKLEYFLLKVRRKPLYKKFKTFEVIMTDGPREFPPHLEASLIKRVDRVQVPTI